MDVELFKPITLLTELYLKGNLCVDKDFVNDDSSINVLEKNLATCNIFERVQTNFNEVAYKKWKLDLHPMAVIGILLGSLFVLIIVLLIILCIIGIYRRMCKRNVSREYQF